MAIKRGWKIFFIILAVLLACLLGITGYFYWNIKLRLLTSLEIRGNELWMNGEINGQTYTQFEDALNENPNIETLVLEIAPGSLDDDTMLRLGYMLREKGINTMLLPNSRIYSGAVDLFLSGKERIIRIEGENVPTLGVHSWFDLISWKEAKDYPKDSPEHNANREYVEDMLGTDDFYWFTIYQSDAAEMYILGLDELQKYGLYTRIEYTNSPDSISRQD